MLLFSLHGSTAKALENCITTSTYLVHVYRSTIYYIYTRYLPSNSLFISLAWTHICGCAYMYKIDDIHTINWCENLHPYQFIVCVTSRELPDTWRGVQFISNFLYNCGSRQLFQMILIPSDGVEVTPPIPPLHVKIGLNLGLHLLALTSSHILAKLVLLSTTNIPVIGTAKFEGRSQF